MLEFLEKIPYLFWFALGLIVLTIVLIGERKNNLKPTYVELEERVKELEREKLNNESKNNKLGKNEGRAGYDSAVDTAAKIYVFKFKFAIIATILAFVIGVMMPLIMN